MQRLVIFVCLLAGGVCRDWTPTQYPNPTTKEGSILCGRDGVLGSVCDPDRYLAPESLDVMEGHIKRIADAQEPYGRSHCSTGLGFQVGVAVLERMSNDGKDLAARAEKFAGDLFDEWGLGTTECGNGALLLVSIKDKQAYIAVGEAIQKSIAVTNLELVINNMKPYLREGDYNTAMEGAVIDLGLVLSGLDPHQRTEQGDTWWPLAIFLAIFSGVVGFVAWSSYREKRQRREVENLLDKLKREQDQAYQSGKYQAKSCPICFEDFDSLPSSPSASGEDKKVDQPSAPPFEAMLDGQTEEAQDSKTPLLIRRKSSRERSTEANSSGQLEANVIVQDSKGRRPLFLPCGHTFCEPCIDEWFKSSGTCPVCRKPVGENAARPSNAIQTRRNRTSDLYQEEMDYRMNRLHRRFPTYVTREMISRACNGTGGRFDFTSVRQSMSQSQVRQSFQQSGHSGSSVSFGGGHHASGGGVGGSW